MIVSLVVLLSTTRAPLMANDAVCIVASESVPGAQQPRVAIDPVGHIYVTFGANEDVYVCKSVDQGQTYTVPVRVGHVGQLALGMRRGPRIVADGNSVVVTAISHESGNLMAWRSDDSGETWTHPTNINDQPKVAREGLHGMAIGPDGLIFCTWLDLRNNRTQIYGASSRDGGQNWTENRRIYASPSGTVCECCHPSVAIHDDGIIYVLWRNALDGNRDMFLARSEDSGQTFGGSEKLGIGNWKLNACPMDGGDLTVAADGSPLTVWRRKQQIFATDVGGRIRERWLGSGEQPSIAANGNGRYLAWVSRRGGDLMLSAPESNTPIRLSESAADPVVSASRASDGPVVLVWESGKKPDISIMASVVSD